MFHFNNLKGLGKQSSGGMLDMIVVDGVVGAGKSTLQKILVDEFGFVPFEETVVNNPILDKFYYDRKRYAFPLQIFFLNERFKYIQEASKIENAILDRSIYGDLIFAKLLKDNGDMTKVEFDIYLSMFHNLIEHCKPPKLMVYLEVSPEEAARRIAKRGRQYELQTDMDYWVKLNKEYRDYFDQYNLSPILKINVDNIDFETNLKDRDYVLTLIKNKLQEVDKVSILRDVL